MDIATIGGFAAGLAVIFLGILYTGLTPLDILNIPALFITFGGAFTAVVIASPLETVRYFINFSRFAITSSRVDITNLISMLVNFSEHARREGLLSLEDHMENVDDAFLKNGIQLVVDGCDPDLIRSILETDMKSIQERHAVGINFWEQLGYFLPAFGMVGTLIGLIQMLKNLGTGDPAAIGAGMAAALITTLYGTLGANLIAIPIKSKLEIRDNEESLVRMIMLEGILSIQSGDNPRIVRDRLYSFISPKQRLNFANEELE